MGGAAATLPLFPPRIGDYRHDADPSLPWPLELAFDYGRVEPSLFAQRAAGPSCGLAAWAPLMPPLTRETNLGEGETPLFEVPALAAWAGIDGPLFLKDEGRNPTWSHKDRLNRCTASAAQLAGAPGVIVASSGNHGASASAYAAAAGLPCIVLASATAPLAMQRFVAAYGGAALAVPADRRWELMARLCDRTGFHPVSNLTPEAHTGHPFAIEGYKSIAYELFRDLGGVAPGCVFVPTGYGELLYGVWKGFEELRALGRIPGVPRLFSCESRIYGPLHRAMRDGRPVAAVGTPDDTTRALSIASPVGGLRGRRAIEESGGAALAMSDAEIEAARARLARAGQWVEFSAAAGLAGLRQQAARAPLPEGPAVCLVTASGMKDVDGKGEALPSTDGSFDHASRVLREHYDLDI
ncbi:pyridoxal-phosphate dependent enzyme [Aquibium sp. A9E412]|uniref:threonine synthase n=1 Tax=Aquibium sp. A9E412 TaxID=2976767 RepID=UPI0025B082A1|nr:pyridoxal-phosphate dependent enzyme [Aquibium sp. A9E412]MDN2567121.1 pyridoxal-phosphate dependent enzyme [Aquibium sp. A9E412]